MYPAAPNFLTYKLAHSFVFATMDVLVPWLSFMRAEGNTGQKSNFSPHSHSASLVIWPLTKLKEPVLASYPFLGLSRTLWNTHFYWEFDRIFLFLRVVVNIPLQTLIILPWLSISHDDYLTAGAWATPPVFSFDILALKQTKSFTSKIKFLTSLPPGKMMILRIAKIVLNFMNLN